MKDCPNCGAVVDGPSCGKCGYGAKAKNTGPADPLRWNCHDELNGQRCAKLGRFTESVQGTERWFCEDHYAPFRRMRASARAAPTDAFRRQRATMRSVGDLLEDDLERQGMREL